VPDATRDIPESFQSKLPQIQQMIEQLRNEAEEIRRQAKTTIELVHESREFLWRIRAPLYAS
jgi:replication fork clamp-binding protein CrfC